MVADPVYVGTAYVNRYAYVVAAKPRRPDSPRAGTATVRQLRPREEWIAVPVPALVDQETFDRVQAQLARNSVLSFRNNTKHTYLLRCLLTCGRCGLAMFGVTYLAPRDAHARRYYRCAGKDPVLRGHGRVCPRRPVTCDVADAAVWDHLVALLNAPERLLEQFHQQAQFAAQGDAHERAEAQRLTARLERLGREDRRLLDAYQAGILSLAELAERRDTVNQRRQAVEDQREQQSRLRRERAHAQTVLTDLRAFCARVRTRLAAATVADQQAILALLVERIIVHDDHLEVRHVIPLRTPDSPTPANGGPAPPRSAANLGLRSDGLGPADLPARLLQPGVGAVAVAAHDAGVVLPQQGLDDPTAAAGRNREDGGESGGHHPQPRRPSRVQPARLIRVDHWRRRQRGAYRGDRPREGQGGGPAQPGDAPGGQGRIQQRATHVRHLALAQVVLAVQHRYRRL